MLLTTPARRDRLDAAIEAMAADREVTPVMHARWVAVTQRRKRPVIANVAVACGLAGWCWSLTVMDE